MCHRTAYYGPNSLFHYTGTHSCGVCNHWGFDQCPGVVTMPLVDIGGTGATIPLTGFGHNLAQGVINGINNEGFLGIFKGGVSATAAGVAAAITFGYVVAVIFNPQG